MPLDLEQFKNRCPNTYFEADNQKYQNQKMFIEGGNDTFWKPIWKKALCHLQLILQLSTSTPGFLLS